MRDTDGGLPIATVRPNRRSTFCTFGTDFLLGRAMSSLNPTSTLYRETPCEHDWMKPHALTDGQGLAERNVIGRCSGGSREVVTIDYEAAAQALALIADGRRWELIPDGTRALYRTHAEVTIDAALKSAGFTKKFASGESSTE